MSSDYSGCKYLKLTPGGRFKIKVCMKNRMRSRASLDQETARPLLSCLLTDWSHVVYSWLECFNLGLPSSDFSPHTVSPPLLRERMCHWFHPYATNHLKREANCLPWTRNLFLTHSTKPRAPGTWGPLLWADIVGLRVKKRLITGQIFQKMLKSIYV